MKNELFICFGNPFLTVTKDVALQFLVIKLSLSGIEQTVCIEIHTMILFIEIFCIVYIELNDIMIMYRSYEKYGRKPCDKMKKLINYQYFV